MKLKRRVGRQMQMPQRLVATAMREMLEELLILLVGDVALRLDPDRFLIVDDFLAELDRMWHERRILLEHRLQSPRLSELFQVRFQMQPNLCAASQSFVWLDGEATAAVRFPFPTFVRLIRPAEDFDFVRQHE